MANLFLGNRFQAFDDNGRPLSGGTAKFFERGTTTPKSVYADANLTSPLGSEVTLDSAGRAAIFLNGDYKCRLENSAGVQVSAQDGINPPVETETSGGNLIANGSFEEAGNEEAQASGWTLNAQSDGTIERITSDSYDGRAAIKFTSDGSGGGLADTVAFFGVSPGTRYVVSFALKCSVADIRNIVQVRYFDKDQSFLSNPTVYDEDEENPTSWEVREFMETPPANARFAKLRILGADQSDSTKGEAKFDSLSVRPGALLSTTEGNVYAYGQKISFETSTFSLAPEHAGKNLDCFSDAGSEMVVAVPDDGVATPDIPIGFTTTVIQSGPDQIELNPLNGATIRSTSSSSNPKTAEQWSAITIYKRATNEWVAIGGIES